jgi:Phospholipid-translocating P-type ATPase C-terminal
VLTCRLVHLHWSDEFSFRSGIFEQDLEPATLAKYPSVYHANRGRLFNYRTVAEYVLGYSIWHGLVIFFGIYFVIGRAGEIIYDNGLDGGLWIASLAASVLVVAAVQFKFFLCTHTLAWPFILGLVLSFGFVFAIVPIAISVFRSNALEGVLGKLLSSVRFHILWPAVFVLMFIPDFLIILRRNGVFGTYNKSTEVMELQRQENRQRIAASQNQKKSKKDSPLFLHRRQPSRGNVVAARVIP